MRFREGMRRIGLVAGVAGALWGLTWDVDSYFELQKRREWAQKFEQLRDTAEVHQVIKAVRENSIRNANFEIKINGIEKVAVEDGQITRIVDSNKETFYSWSKRPAFWEYGLPPLPPIIGFLLCWGVVKLFTWVVSGFLKPSPAS